MAVSDRIAVMNNGDIQQIGTPKVLYQRPANLFVATFIGHTNVLNGELKVKDGKPYLVLPGDYEVLLDTVMISEIKDQKVKASIRPEEFIVDINTFRHVRKRNNNIFKVFNRIFYHNFLPF